MLSRRFERGDVPIVAEILLVAVTVVIASILATFVFSVDAPQRLPQTAFEFAYDDADDCLTIVHDSGSAIDPDALVIAGDGIQSGSGDCDNDVTQSGTTWPTAAASGRVRGQTVVVAGDAIDVGVADAYEVTLIYRARSGSGSPSAIIARDSRSP